jgi:hypothetical protein
VVLEPAERERAEREEKKHLGTRERLVTGCLNVGAGVGGVREPLVVPHNALARLEHVVDGMRGSRGAQSLARAGSRERGSLAPVRLAVQPVGVQVRVLPQMCEQALRGRRRSLDGLGDSWDKL